MAVLHFLPDHPVVAVRKSILVHGHQPISVWNWNAKAPCRHPGKQAFETGWPEAKGLPSFDPKAQNTGIVSNNIHAIDIDIDDEGAAREAVALCEQCLGKTPLVRYRENSARRTLVYKSNRRKGFVIPTNKGQIEVRGEGLQFVAHGWHPTGFELHWEDDSPANFAVENLPEATDEAEQRFKEALREALGGPPAAQSEPEPARPARTWTTLTPYGGGVRRSRSRCRMPDSRRHGHRRAQPSTQQIRLQSRRLRRRPGRGCGQATAFRGR